MMWRVISGAVMLLVMATVALAQAPTDFMVRHTHYFVICNDADTAPTISVQSRGVYTYPDALKLRVIDDQSEVRMQRVVALGGSLEQQIPGPAAPLYLVIAEPGMNGVIFGCDRPWGIMASGSYGLGSSGKVPPLHLYVPPECESFTIKAQATSPGEGLRLVVQQPDGAEALVMDGEFDAAEEHKVEVPAPARGEVWALTLSDPQTADARLDDIQLWVDGYLAPLLWPSQEWAEVEGPKVWLRQKAVLDQQ